MVEWFTEDPDDVWEGLDDRMRRRVHRWVARAETIIRARFPDLRARVAAGSIDAAAVAGVVEEMVDRAIQHEERDGISQEALPEWSVTYETGSGLGAGSILFLTTDEYALLAPPRRRPAGISSMRMRRSHEVEDPTPAVAAPRAGLDADGARGRVHRGPVDGQPASG